MKLLFLFFYFYSWASYAERINFSLEEALSSIHISQFQPFTRNRHQWRQIKEKWHLCRSELKNKLIPGSCYEFISQHEALELSLVEIDREKLDSLCQSSVEQEFSIITLKGSLVKVSEICQKQIVNRIELLKYRSEEPFFIK